MNKEQFLQWRKENFPAQCFVEQITDLINDEMINAPIDYIHTSNYFWKEIAFFCLEQIE